MIVNKDLLVFEKICESAQSARLPQHGQTGAGMENGY
jgi:hypothetical protein